MVKHLANETDLLARARVGDSEAFGTLVSHYYQPIHRLALKITENTEDANDVTQDALLKAFCKLGKFRESSRFYTWLVRITVNQALMTLRKRRSQRELLWEDLIATGAGEFSSKLKTVLGKASNRLHLHRLCRQC